MTSPRDPQDKEYLHIRGTQADLLDRLAVSELCKGWPVYRDASEWKNYRSLFAEDAYVWTSEFSLPYLDSKYPPPSFHIVHYPAQEDSSNTDTLRKKPGPSASTSMPSSPLPSSARPTVTSSCTASAAPSST